jgi:hypothetical protein
VAEGSQSPGSPIWFLGTPTFCLAPLASPDVSVTCWSVPQAGRPRPIGRHDSQPCPIGTDKPLAWLERGARKRIARPMWYIRHQPLTSALQRFKPLPATRPLACPRNGSQPRRSLRKSPFRMTARLGMAPSALSTAQRCGFCGEGLVSPMRENRVRFTYATIFTWRAEYG